MSERCTLPLDALEGRLLAAPAAPGADSSVSVRVQRVAQLADRGDYLAAAGDAADALRAGTYDIRLIGFYLLGLFIERGVAYLPDLLRRVVALLTEDYAAVLPARRKQRVVDAALTWLFQNLVSHALFHTKGRDATWTAWVEASEPDLADTVGAEIERVVAAAESVVAAAEPDGDPARSVKPLFRLRRWAKEDLGRAIAARARAAAAAGADAPTAAATAQPSAPAGSVSAEPGDSPPGDARSLADEAGDGPRPGPHDAGRPDGALVDLEPTDGRGSDGAPETDAAWSVREPADAPGDPPARPARLSPTAVVIDSPALTALMDKLRGFGSLVSRGEYAKAAIIASDIRAVIEGFDPVTFLPALFAPYFKLLHGCIEQLEPYWDSAGSVGWHTLDQLYRADLDGFINE